jgi:hypothetical protein
MTSLYLSIVYYFIKAFNFFVNMDPGYLDLVKIFAGCTGWIGGLTMYMWLRERKKEAARVLAKQLSR